MYAEDVNGFIFWTECPSVRFVHEEGCAFMSRILRHHAVVPGARGKVCCLFAAR